MLVINEQIQIPKSEFEFDFVRSSGPGGQNVNKVNSKVVLRWKIDATNHVPDDVMRRFKKKFRHRISKDDIFIMTSQRYRDQRRNIEDCLQKVAELLRSIVNPPKIRKKTKPSKASKIRRLRTKQLNSQKKQLRKSPTQEH